MSQPTGSNKVPPKDMYWFAHGGVESSNDKCLNQKNTTLGEHEEDACDSSSPTSLRSLPERRVASDEQKHLLTTHPVSDHGNSSGPSSLEMKDDRNRDKRIAVEERRKLLWEAEQERNDAVLRKHMEREAAIEARRNAQRSNIAFAFGSSVPRNVENLDSDRSNKQTNASGLSPKEENHDIDLLRRSVSPSNLSGAGLESGGSQTNVCWDRRAFSPPCWLVGSGALIGEDAMSKSMTAAVPAPRGRRKNDLMPTVPYNRTTATPKSTSSGTTRKRSVSMTRLDQLAQPRRHYVEANKACSTTSSGTPSMVKDSIKSPTRPLSSASEQSGGSGRLGTSSVTRRLRSSPRKPRPVSIAGTVPDGKPPEIKVSPIKKTPLSSKKPQAENKKATPSSTQPSAVKSNEKVKRVEKPKLTSTPIAASKTVKQGTTKQPPPPKASSPKVSSAKRATTNKKKADLMVSSQQSTPVKTEDVEETQKPASPPPPDGLSEGDRNNAKRIISEEEAKAALAEKRRLAREQAEKEAELEKQRLEEIRLEEEERLRKEEEEQKRLEEEALQLLQEHQRVEEEKLRKAIEENERKEEEERVKREEEQRLKAEMERKAQEEAEKQRIELEEKLRKEEEERAERKKRLEKIMSRTRGKSSNTSPSGSVSGSEQFDSSENQQENFSSGANSLESNSAEENNSEPTSLECQPNKSELVSEATSLEAHPAYDVSSDNESLVDIIMPKSETASQDNSLVIVPEEISTNPFESHFSGSADPKEESNVENFALDPKSFSSEENKPLSLEVNQLSTEAQDSKNSEHLEKTNDIEEHSSVKVAEDMVEAGEKVSLEAASFTAAAVSAAFDTGSSERDEVVSPVDEDRKMVIDEDRKFSSTSASYSDSNSTLLPDAPLCSESEASAGQGGQDEAEREQHSHLSTSSDIKLPDPIYETSDDGSVSSEKHPQDGLLQEEEPHQASGLVADEVFSVKGETHFDGSEKFDLERSSNLMAAESQIEVCDKQNSMHSSEVGDAVPSNVEQPREIGEENVYPTRSPTSSLPEAGDNFFGAQGDVGPFQNEENKENILDYDMTSSQCGASTTGAGDHTNNYDFYADKENMEFSFPHTIPSDMLLFNNNTLPEQSDSKVSQIQSHDESPVVAPEQTAVQFAGNPFAPQSSINLSNEEAESGTITLIKAEGSGECVGIISSVEHDQVVSNELNMQNELLVSNFDYNSITDSEDSSLDSNLSQVMTAEVSEKNSVISVDESSVVLNNGQTGNPFERPAINGSGDYKTNGDYSKTGAYSNGHRFDASDSKLGEIGSYTQLDSKHISSVDHSSNNIFDNVDAVDFGKMSPDPFLAKGTSNSISGNPFLLQEEQKQVIMTPDFLN